MKNLIFLQLMTTLTTFADTPDTFREAPFKSGYATVNGINMYYQIHGKGGMPLILIHGGGSTIESSFGAILPQLSAQGEVVAVELQAHGRTSDRNKEETFEQDADDVAALVKFLKIEKANFLGFSNGGNTAMQIGIRHPEIVNKLVIASAFYKRDGMVPGFFEGMLQASLDNMPAQLKEAYLKVAPDRKGLQTMFERDKNRMLTFKDWKDEDLRAIRAKTLFLVADHDVVSPEHTVSMFHLIPNAQLMILPGTHGSYLGEICSAVPGSKIPEMTVNMVEEFLRD